MINRTGLPDDLKSGLERLGGVSLDDVRVQYDSPEPAHLDALAFTRGREIHVGPGQQSHLGHEGWHVVQQKQGRVRRTHWLDEVPVNADAALEAEADRIGRRIRSHPPATPVASGLLPYTKGEGVVQGVWADQEAMAERGLNPRADLAHAMQALSAFVAAGGGGLNQDEKDAFNFVAGVFNDRDISARVTAFLEPTFGEGTTWTSEALVRGVIQAAEDPEEDVDHASEDVGTTAEDIPFDNIRWGEFSLGKPRERQILQELFVEQVLQYARRADELTPGQVELLFFRWYSDGVWTRARLSDEIVGLLDPRPRGGGPTRTNRDDRYSPYGRTGRAVPRGSTREAIQTMRDEDEPVQRKANPGTLSFKTNYITSLNGVFQNVGYMRDGQANIDFATVVPPTPPAVQVWNDPTIAGSLINLAQGSANPKRGFISAKQQVKIAPGGSRNDHFQIANFLTGLNPGGNPRHSPPNKTWHHLTIAGYHMHLVDMLVHKKHSHVGGMNFWK